MTSSDNSISTNALDKYDTHGEKTMLLYLASVTSKSQPDPARNNPIYQFPDGSYIIHSPHTYVFVPTPSARNRDVFVQTRPAHHKPSQHPVIPPPSQHLFEYPTSDSIRCKVLERALEDAMSRSDVHAQRYESPLSDTEANIHAPDLQDTLSQIMQVYSPSDMVSNFLDSENDYCAQRVIDALPHSQFKQLVDATVSKLAEATPSPD